MKNFFKPVMIACAIVLTATTFTSCGDETNDGIIDDGSGTDSNGNKIKELVVTATDLTPSLDISETAGSTKEILIKFSGADKNMKRLYITQNVYGNENGIQVYDLSTSTVVDTKGDGSIDLSKTDATEFSFKIPFDAPLSDGGVTQYKLWATGGVVTSKGDIRNISLRNAFDSKAVGTITITAGTANQEVTTMKYFNAKLLDAPLADGTSNSFMSVYDGKTYAIAGASETAALWDFGYFYTSSKKASFASTSAYTSTKVLNVPKLSKVNQDDLNKFFIEKSSLTVKEFDEADTATLNNLKKPVSEIVTNLSKDNILVFQDTYGAKGLIKIKSIKPGDGSTGEIKFEVKVQSIEPIKL